MTREKKPKPGSERWSKSSEMLLLAYVSLHADQASGHVETIQVSAAEFLSSELQQTYEARHVKDKVKRLWDRYGREKASSVDEIYEFGANPRTLPGLELYQEGIFEELCEKISDLKRSRGEIKCTCPFAVEDGGPSVCCEKCGFWQHVHCYYGQDVAAVPESHMCKKCAVMADAKKKAKKRRIDELEDELPHDERFRSDSRLSIRKGNLNVPIQITELQKEIRRLQLSSSNKLECIRDLKADLEVSKALRNSRSLRDTGYNRAMSCAPSNGSICDTMAHIQGQIHRLVIPMPLRAKEVDLPCLQGIQKQIPELWNYLRLHCGVQFGLTHRSISSDASQISLSLQQLLRTIISTVITDWILQPDIFHMTQTELPIFKALSRCAQDQDELDALRSLHQASWHLLTKLESHEFDEFVGRTAKSLKQRLDDLVTPLFSLVKLNSIEDQSRIHKRWIARQGQLEEILTNCLRLKANIPFRRQYFEFYMPKTGTKFDDNLMEAEVGVEELEEPDDASVSACLFPAAVVYPTRFSGAREENTDDITDCFLGVSRRDDDRGDGEVVLKAVVWL